jgi:hypothetical protein
MECKIIDFACNDIVVACLLVKYLSHYTFDITRYTMFFCLASKIFPLAGSYTISTLSSHQPHYRVAESPRSQLIEAKASIYPSVTNQGQDDIAR